MKTVRQFRGWLGISHQFNRGRVTSIEVFVRAEWIIRAYYAVLFYFAVALLPEWPALLKRTNPSPLWPVAWLNAVHLETGIAIVLAGYLIGTFLAAIWPQKRVPRLLAFAGLFEFWALNNSYGKIGHSLHLWVLTSALLIFLPGNSKNAAVTNRLFRQKYLALFTGIQALTLLIYTMSGLGKLLGAIYQISQGEPNIFMPKALALIVAERLAETNSPSLLGPFLMDHPWVGWPLMWVDLYVQLFAIAVLFRPVLHRAWGIALIVFHLGAYFLMTINFAQNCLLIALLLLNSPYAPPKSSWRAGLAALPLFGRFFVKPCAS